MLASLHGHLESVKLLLSHGAHASAAAADSEVSQLSKLRLLVCETQPA